MWYLYLDESGDLGFDFVSKNPSKFFTISILALSTQENNRALIKAVAKTLRRKLNPKNKRKRIVHELKGSSTTFEVKKYFYEQVKNIKFAIYSISLNKKRVYTELIKNKPRVYNFISRILIDEIPFEKANIRIELIIDKSKAKPEIKDFNNYIRRALEARINPKVPLDVYHWDSKTTHGLQAVDMFAWGIFQKYERHHQDWFNIFKDKIVFNEPYL